VERRRKERGKGERGGGKEVGEEEGEGAIYFTAVLKFQHTVTNTFLPLHSVTFRQLGSKFSTLEYHFNLEEENERVG
jgi:hypothetical protein